MLTVDDLLALRGVSDAAISPDGSRVAFVVGAALAGPHAEPGGSQIWLVSASGGDARALTSGPRRDTAPAWAPDGQALAFLSDRAEPGVNLLYVLALAGGEARALPVPEGKLGSFAWSPDGAKLACIVRERAIGGGGRDGKQAPIVVDAELPRDQLWLVDVAGAPAELAYGGPDMIWECGWSPLGDGLALVVSDEPAAASWYHNRLAWLDLDRGDLRTIHTPPAGRQVARPRPAPDGRHVAFVACSWSDPGMSGGDLWVAPVTGEAARNLTPGVTYSVHCAAWLSASELLFEAYDDGGTRVGRASLNAAPRSLWRDDATFGFSAIQINRGGEFARVRETSQQPADVWLARPGADALDWRRLTALHPDAPRVPGATETLRWHATDGVELSGLLTLPDTANAPYPLVVMIHGGPTGMANHRLATRGFAALGPLLAARGVAVFWPNYRGSNGRGVAFAEANHGDLGGGDWNDVDGGINELVAQGIAEGQRIAIGGWSYGGYMTMWAVTQNRRFKAAVAGAGIANWFSMHGVTDLHSWERIFLGPDPYDTGGVYATRSPLFQARNVTTPLLLLHGDADRDVPPSQSQEFYRALRDHDREVEFVLYPGAPHGPYDPGHVRDIMERALAWFTKHLELEDWVAATDGLPAG